MARSEGHRAIPPISGRDASQSSMSGIPREASWIVRDSAEAATAAAAIARLFPDPERHRVGILELLMNALGPGYSEARAVPSGGALHEEMPTSPSVRPEVEARLVRYDDAIELMVKAWGPGLDRQQQALASLSAPSSGRAMLPASKLAFDHVRYLASGDRVVARTYLDRTTRQPIDPVQDDSDCSHAELRELQGDIVALLQRSIAPEFFDELVKLALAWSCSPLGFVSHLGQGNQLQVMALASVPHQGSRSVSPHQLLQWIHHGAWGKVRERGGTSIDNEPQGRGLDRTLGIAMTFNGRLVGTLNVGNKADAYERADAFRLEAIAAKIAPVFAARLEIDAAERRGHELSRMYREIELDHNIARRVLSKMLGETGRPGALQVYEKAAGNFCGDVVLGASLPGGRHRWLLADFVGHGLGAALGTIPLAQAFHAVARKGVALEESVVTFNRIVGSTLPPGMFAAACVCEYWPAQGQLQIWNGGMPPAFIVGARQVRSIEADKLALGIVSGNQFDAVGTTLDVLPEDQVVLVSDGVLEAEDPAGVLFGVQRLTTSFGEPDVFRAAVDSLNHHLGQRLAGDDLSLIVVKLSELAADTGIQH